MIDWERTFAFLANVAQVASAIFVLGGGILIYRQLNQIRTEERHKKWEALQWALSLFSTRDVIDFHDTLFKDPSLHSSRYELVERVHRGLELITLAIKHGYLDQDLYFRARGSALYLLRRDEVYGRMSRLKGLGSVFVGLNHVWWEFDGEIGAMIDRAEAWTKLHRSEQSLRAQSLPGRPHKD